MNIRLLDVILGLTLGLLGFVLGIAVAAPDTPERVPQAASTASAVTHERTNLQEYDVKLPGWDDPVSFTAFPFEHGGRKCIAFIPSHNTDWANYIVNGVDCQ